MATELAKAYVQIIPSAKGIAKGISDKIDPEAKPAGESFGSKLAGAIKKIAATAAIGKFIGKTLTEGANLEQSIGGIETLFKGSADKVKANAAEAYRTAGMSANEYMELTTSFSASLLSSLSNDTNKAADIADMAMTDMSDNANKMGTDMESIKNAYQGFAKQNYTMLDNLKLGYGGTKEEMQRLLQDAQKITGVKYDINNLSDVYSAIHVIQGELDITGTTAKEAATTLSGSMASMKAAFSNVLGNLAIGGDLTSALEGLASTTATFFFGNLVPMLGRIVTGLPSALIGFVKAAIPELTTQISGLIPDIINGLQGAQTGVQIVSDIVDGILQGIPTLLATIGGIVMELGDTLVSLFPQILQAAADLVMNFANSLIENLPYITTSAAVLIATLLATIGGNLPQILQSGLEIIGNLAAGLIRAIPNLVAKIPQIITGIKSTFDAYDWKSIGKNIIDGIAKGLKNAASALWTAVKDVLGSFKDQVLKFFGIHSPSKWGMYVGEMIDEGLANGIVENVSLVSSAADELRARTMNPIEALSANYSISEQRTKTNETAGRLDKLIMLLQMLANKDQKVSVQIGEREFIRLLRDMGVVFE